VVVAFCHQAVLAGVAADCVIVDGNTGERRVLWSAIRRVVAASSARLCRRTWLLLVEFADRENLIVTEADPHRSALVTAIEATLPDTVSSVVWQFRLEIG
jgi:hypothetical protein